MSSTNIARKSQSDTVYYQIQKVLQKRTTKSGKQQYRIRWKGFPPSCDTWQPKQHIKEAKDCQEQANYNFTIKGAAKDLGNFGGKQINKILSAISGGGEIRSRSPRDGSRNELQTVREGRGRSKEMVDGDYSQSNKIVIQIKLQNMSRLDKPKIQCSLNQKMSKHIKQKHVEPKIQNSSCTPSQKVRPKIKATASSPIQPTNPIEYPVDAIVDKKISQNGLYFLYRVRWTGYSPEKDTWEPIQNLKNVKHLVEKYDNANKKTKRIKKLDSSAGRPQHSFNEPKKIKPKFESASKVKQFFQVQRILSKRILPSGTYYKVHWKGYSLKKATWQPKKNLQRVQRLVQQFQTSQKQRVKQEQKLNKQRQQSKKKKKEINKQVATEKQNSHIVGIHTNINGTNQNQNQGMFQESVEYDDYQMGGINQDYLDECRQLKLHNHYRNTFMDSQIQIEQQQPQTYQNNPNSQPFTISQNLTCNINLSRLASQPQAPNNHQRWDQIQANFKSSLKQNFSNIGMDMGMLDQSEGLDGVISLEIDNRDRQIMDDLLS